MLRENSNNSHPPLLVSAFSHKHYKLAGSRCTLRALQIHHHLIMLRANPICKTKFESYDYHKKIRTCHLQTSAPCHGGKCILTVSQLDTPKNKVYRGLNPTTMKCG